MTPPLARVTLFAIGALAFVAATPAGAAKRPKAPPPATPALWKIADEDTTIFLFGAPTHLPTNAKWRSREVARALESADTYWFEAPVSDPAAQKAAQAIFEKYGNHGAQTKLSETLEPEMAEQLAVIAAAAGLPTEQVETFKPWAAFVLLSGAQTTALGGEAGGVEATLLSEAVGRGRRIKFLDTVEASLALLTSMPAEDQQLLLTNLITDWDRTLAEADKAFEAWRIGDIEATDAFANAALRERAPGAYERLVADRAARLAAAIAKLLEAPGANFVALNTSYAVGAGSIPQSLADMGVSVMRIDPSE